MFQATNQCLNMFQSRESLRSSSHETKQGGHLEDWGHSLEDNGLAKVL